MGFNKRWLEKGSLVAIYRNEGIKGIENWLNGADALITTDEFSEGIMNIYDSEGTNEDRFNEISMKISEALIKMG
jgi:hypothetical protein